MGRVVRLIESYGSFLPPEVHRSCWNGHIQLSVDNIQSAFALDVSENHQSGIDYGVVSDFFFSAVLVRALFTRLTLAELLNQQPALPSGMLG